MVKFAEAGWSVRDLPPREAVEQWILGCRVVARRRWRGKKRKPYHEAAAALGVTVGEARRAERALMLVAEPLFSGKLRRA